MYVLRDQVPDPLRLTHSEVKSYGMKLVFRIDISGWLVSVEAPLVFSVVTLTPLVLLI